MVGMFTLSKEKKRKQESAFQHEAHPTASPQLSRKPLQLKTQARLCVNGAARIAVLVQLVSSAN